MGLCNICLFLWSLAVWHYIQIKRQTCKKNTCTDWCTCIYVGLPNLNWNKDWKILRMTKWMTHSHKNDNNEKIKLCLQNLTYDQIGWLQCTLAHTSWWYSLCRIPAGLSPVHYYTVDFKNMDKLCTLYLYRSCYMWVTI